MKTGWPKIKLGEVLRYRKEFITIDDLSTYKRPRVQLHAKGIILRDEIVGALIKTKQQQVCKSGDFLVAEIDAKVGGFGIVPDSLDGAIVSSHYFLFVIDELKIDKSFLDYFTRTPRFRDQIEAQGSTNYASIRPADVLDYEISLPPLLEQRRIVAMVEELCNKIAEARKLQYQSENLLDSITGASFRALIQENFNNPSWMVGPMPNFIEINPSRRGKINLRSDDKVSFVPMRSLDETNGTILPENRLFSEVAKGFTYFLDGDVIFARITPCMENGKSAVVRNLVNGVGFGSTEFHVLRPRAMVLCEWIHLIVRHKDFRDDSAAHFKGTAGQQRVPDNFFYKK